MKIQLAYRVTGENKNEVINVIKNMKEILTRKGHEVYAPILDSNLPDDRAQALLYALKKLESTDAIFCLIKNSFPSVGMSIETGYAKGINKKVIIAINEEVNNVSKGLADYLIIYRAYDVGVGNLYNKLEELSI
ncbi:MAG: nucleoside 2-deoxyribosyltransferase [Nanoarchaeota archaeon]